MAPFTLRWGILATGYIAETFTKDLLLDPSITRSVNDVNHTVLAAASSTSHARAASFLKSVNAPSTARAYGSYTELLQDPEIDIVYVATPHSHHYQNTMACLQAGKHVLCEKAFTVNEAQARKLCAEAEGRNLFLMEAVWTRFFPISVKVREWVREGRLGDVYRVIADNSFGVDVEGQWGTGDRMVNMDLAGGALLDLGIYSLTWVFQTLYHTQPPSSRQPPNKVLAMIDQYPKTGADENTSIIVRFPSGPPTPSSGSSDSHTPHPAQGIALTNFRVASDPDAYNTARPAIRIQGTKGEICIDGPAYRPTRLIFVPAVHHGPSTHYAGTNPNVEEHVFDIPGQGMFWEADECARCVRDGKLQSETMGWEESCVIMGVMDEVRKQGGVKYSEKLESLEYPLELS